MNDLRDIFNKHEKSVVDFIDGVRTTAYQQGRADGFNEFVAKYKEFQNEDCDVALDVTRGFMSCNGECINCFVKWYKEHGNERTTDKTI